MTSPVSKKWILEVGFFELGNAIFTDWRLVLFWFHGLVDFHFLRTLSKMRSTNTNWHLSFAQLPHDRRAIGWEFLDFFPWYLFTKLHRQHRQMYNYTWQSKVHEKCQNSWNYYKLLNVKFFLNQLTKFIYFQDTS